MAQPSPAKFLLSLFLLILFAPVPAHAEAFASLKAAREFTDKVMARVSGGDLEGGIRMIKPYTPTPDEDVEALVGQSRQQAPVIAQRFGKSVGYEFLREQQVGESLARFTYIQKFDRYAMQWLFILYKGTDGWTVGTFTFNDRVQSLFP